MWAPFLTGGHIQGGWLQTRGGGGIFTILGIPLADVEQNATIIFHISLLEMNSCNMYFLENNTAKSDDVRLLKFVVWS